MEVWTPEGEKRKASQREDDFKDDLEDFFKTASCTKFSDEIQDYYKGKSDRYRDDDDDDKRRRAPLRDRPATFQSPVDKPAFFSSLAGVGGTNKVAVVTKTSTSLKSALATAAEIAEQTKRR